MPGVISSAFLFKLRSDLRQESSSLCCKFDASGAKRIGDERQRREALPKCERIGQTCQNVEDGHRLELSNGCVK